MVRLIFYQVNIIKIRFVVNEQIGKENSLYDSPIFRGHDHDLMTAQGI